ncbi:MAG: RsbRD N-terminal domain-containing protein [Proteobacteria bacterium]|nr:RsbRD N-terminal domain-containing protein [Pseudomonadota bacterium]MBU1716036.1 RsbRD N-terminal domain-containing protein [Pseudomonadota bacterium]
MKLSGLLAEKKSAIVKKWVNHLLGTYSLDSSGFLQKQTDRFANPIGHFVNEGLNGLYDILCDKDATDVTAILENLINIRAVQDFSPSRAVAFVFAIKKIVREVCDKEKENGELLVALPDFDKKVDNIALQAFDLYMTSRERLFQVRIKELKSGNYILTDRAKCSSAMLREDQRRQNEKTDINHSTT